MGEAFSPVSLGGTDILVHPEPAEGSVWPRSGLISEGDYPLDKVREGCNLVPYRLCSLWTMYRLHLEKFTHNVKILLEWKNLPHPGATGAFPAEGGPQFADKLDGMSSAFRDLGLSVSAKRASIFASSLRQPTATWESFKQQCAELYNVLVCESEERLFLYVPPEKAAYYSSDFPLGALIEERFPSTKYDIGEAARCFALGRSTACVFHLMRVLERGLRILAVQFNVSAEHRNWQNIIDEIQAKVKQIAADKTRPESREQQEFYAQVIHHFIVLKDAWRNYTVHVRGKYDEHEARLILENVRAFMEKLAGLVSEP